MVVTMIVVA